MTGNSLIFYCSLCIHQIDLTNDLQFDSFNIFIMFLSCFYYINLLSVHLRTEWLWVRVTLQSSVSFESSSDNKEHLFNSNNLNS